MASLHASFTSVVSKNGNFYSPTKFPSTTFFPGFDVVGRVSNACKKEICLSAMSSGPKATLTFDPSTTSWERSKHWQHTIDPMSPNFMPFPTI
ncbi:hypothetical protein CXB51_016285 [Gossypium anomalum]|uniref:Uncharacterized protein n=1 Tax=Gossypium anomalum TaxID=47600 RepID=A0A8J5YZZ3_9ROSI|nr:hypothetical protein CXB51_016285 [Gossypium anomalum]